MRKNTKSLLKHPPFVSQQTELFLLLLHLRSFIFEAKASHSGLQSVNDSSFDSCSLKAGHSSMGLHWKPSSHSPETKLLSHFQLRPLLSDLTYSKHRFPLRHTSLQLSLRPTLPIPESTTSWHRGSPFVPGTRGIPSFACSATQPHIHLQMSNIVYQSKWVCSDIPWDCLGFFWILCDFLRFIGILWHSPLLESDLTRTKLHFVRACAS